MVPDRDYYVDKTGKLTDDPTEYARQIGVKGCFLDPKVANRYGIGSDVVVPVNEPGAPRRMMGSFPETSRRRKTAANESSVEIAKEDEAKEPTTGPAAEEPATEQPSSGDSAVEPEAEKSKAPAKKAAAQKEGKKK